MVGLSLPRSALALTLSVAMAGIGAPGPAHAHAQDPTEEVSVPDAPTPAASTDQRTAILPIVVDGELSDADRATLTDELVSGLQRGSFGVVAPDEVLAATKAAASCESEACFKKVAKATNATHVVSAKVTTQDRDYQVGVELFDGATGVSLARVQEGCEICGIADAGNLISSAAATLRTKLDALAKGPSTVTIASTPEDAVVTIDGDVVGTTPLDRPVIPGKHVVRVTKDGFISVEREVDVVEGVAESLQFELEKVPSRLPKRPWGYASLGVGVVGLGAGVALTFLHDRPFKVGGNCKEGDIDRNGQCRFLWDTKWYGMGAAIAGAALTTLGVAILLSTAGKRAKKKKKDEARTRVGVGPGSFVVEGRF